MHIMPLNAQFYDKFESNIFFPWQVDTSKFAFDNGKLVSNSSIINDAFTIAVPMQKPARQWDFFTELKFNTSSANFVDFFLFANKSNLSLSDTALFLRIGNTRDEISIYQKIGVNTTLLYDGIDDKTNKNNNAIQLNMWLKKDSLFLKYSLNPSNPSAVENFSVLIDNNRFNLDKSFTGFNIKQSTASFFGKHFFDDFYAGPIILDTIAPSLKNIILRDSNKVTLFFSENIKPSLLEKLNNYLLSPQIISPTNAFTQSEDSVLLTFNNAFLSGDSQTLIVDSFADIAGNLMMGQSIKFLYRNIVTPQFKDIIITEIYSKPLNSGLNVEALEIYNSTNNFIDISGCSLSDLTSSQTFANFILSPRTYYVLCDNNDTSFFANDNKIWVTTLPSLNDDDDRIAISDRSKQIIYNVYYQKSWHDVGKSDGGWSLEMIDKNKACATSENFKSCTNRAGHTLGLENSNSGSLIAVALPKLVDFYIENSKTIRLTWQHPLDFSIAVNFNQYTLFNNTLDSIKIKHDNPNIVYLYYNKQFNTINNDFKINAFVACNGNIFNEMKFVFDIPKTPAIGQIKFAEIMFNAKTDCAEYIEFDNVSNQFLDIKNIFLAYQLSTTFSQENICVNGAILQPNQKLIITNSISNLSFCHNLCENTLYLEYKNWQTLDDNNAQVWLTDFRNRLIDSIVYEEGMHSIFISDNDGVALEKFDTTQAGWQKTAWTSIGQARNYATPGCENKILQITDLKEDFAAVNPYFVTSSGNEEKAVIAYNLSLPNYSVNIFVTDRLGNLVKQIANNELLSLAGNIFWDGTDAGNKLVAAGIYFVRISAIHPKGKTINKTLEITKL